MGYEDKLLASKVATLMDERAAAALHRSRTETGEAAVASLDEAADNVTYSDTIEAVLQHADVLASELDGDLRCEVEEIAQRLRNRRDRKLAQLAES
jgi:hypothetical protein